MRRTPQADTPDYVECDECGAPVEDHDAYGWVANYAEPVHCVGYTMADKRRLRAEVGLSARSAKHRVT